MATRLKSFQVELLTWMAAARGALLRDRAESWRSIHASANSIKGKVEKQWYSPPCVVAGKDADFAMQRHNNALRQWAAIVHYSRLE